MVEKRQKRRPTTVVGSPRKAIYLRKSRDESKGTEDVLEKHRNICVSLCERNGWSYTIYQEVGSSDSLDERPQMLKLLDDVEDGLYNGVVVVEYDRLSRGDELDAAIIKRTFRNAGVKVITPLKEYDLDDETQEVLMGVEALLARLEYRKIKRRLQRGKVEGATLGKWVNGPPPFPYVYDREKKRVVVDESKREYYLMMLGDALAGHVVKDIAVKLNTLGVKTNRKKPWTPETVHRNLLSPFHMGRIVYGKTRVDKEGKVILTSPEEWNVGEGDHERLKTPEQHARLLELFASRKRIERKAREGKHPLSGLVKCGLCGRTHQCTVNKGRVVLYPCQRHYPDGTICLNSGARAEHLYVILRSEIEDRLNEFSSEVDGASNRKLSSVQLLEAKRRELAKEENRISTLVDMILNGELSRELGAKKREPIEATIRNLRVEIAQLEEATASGAMPQEERLSRLSALVDPVFWTNHAISDDQRHKMLCAVIHHITMWSDAKGKRVTIDVSWK